ncbi:Histidinol phosphatase and related hydrolases of the PHP family [Candidatus Syntrophocurvum alkaliphilum]|uniref:Histidinol phosphatase and related hydrolases of the PHP family n=1 Tax=Candidatus Syntrophocurvum alkaliphilum TaxID=2293317 RepID=A0A6I6DGZ8_9FIRM|nr:PHP domain-containing protein [Candidatus Syntrophocurvum alkaliphilum]QGU00363.1 Histidinol phosphatase and related hydrolases of the PHP family [Candidatus Syntrophocurvum alkaliphilum]
MEFYGDYHVHCRASDGNQTVEEIAEVALQKGLKEVAVTDHGPLAAVIGVKNCDVYLQLRKKINEINSRDLGLKILLGAEANVRDFKGTLDIDKEVMKSLDILIIGLHPYTLPTSIADGLNLFLQNSLRHLGKKERAKAVKNNTIAIIEALSRNPEVDILSHPGLFFNVDIEQVAEACRDNQVLFEINCGHEYPEISDIIKAERVGANFIVNSDSHFKKTVGDLKYGSKLVESLGIKPERVVNSLHMGGNIEWKRKMITFKYS